MEIKVIENEQQYKAYLDKLEEIFDAQPGTQQAEQRKLLILVLKAYEDEHYPIPAPDPIEAIKIRMQDLGMKRKDLEPFIGDKTMVSKILNHKRALTVEQIRNLHKGLGIPAEILIRPTLR
jgi:HTH-type transcriptional regulator / antitoxin HigA